MAHDSWPRGAAPLAMSHDPGTINNRLFNRLAIYQPNSDIEEQFDNSVAGAKMAGGPSWRVLGVGSRGPRVEVCSKGSHSAWAVAC